MKTEGRCRYEDGGGKAADQRENVTSTGQLLAYPMCVSLTGVVTSPESGLWSTERGVPVTLNSEHWEEWDLGKLPVRVFTPEELRKKKQRERETGIIPSSIPV